MRKYAVINQTNEVVNVIVWDGGSGWRPPASHIAVATNVAGIGWTFDRASGAFAPPEPPDGE